MRWTTPFARHRRMRMSDTDTWLRIERNFDAPIELIWVMWTDPERFKSWYQ